VDRGIGFRYDSASKIPLQLLHLYDVVKTMGKDSMNRLAKSFTCTPPQGHWRAGCSERTPRRSRAFGYQAAIVAD
jgi:hypothetical protein